MSPVLASAQSNFPVGLTLEYEIESRYTFNTQSHMVSYEFTQWIDEEQGTIELLIDSTATEVTYPEGSVTVIAGFPLWTDVSNWEVGETTNFGSFYELSHSTRNGYSCWYLRGETDGPDDFDGEYWNIYYERTYGFLVFYGHIAFSGTSISEQTATLEENNLNSFKFLGGFFDTPLGTILLVGGILIELVIISKLWYRRSKRT
jgi:hypothetical protein